MEEPNHTSQITNAPEQPRTVLPTYAKEACESMAAKAQTRLASALLRDAQQKLRDASFVTLDPRSNSLKSKPIGTIWIGTLWSIIDDHVTRVIRECEVQLAECQIESLKVIGNPAAHLARAMLEQHRNLISSWAQMRTISMSEEEHARWRSFIKCAVELNNLTAELLKAARLAQVSNMVSEQLPMAEIATSCLGALLVRGQIDKPRALMVVSLIFDYIHSCLSISALPVSIRLAWDKVRDSVDSQNRSMPARESAQLFPRRLLMQVQVDSDQNTGEHLRAPSAENAMILATDYERLATQLRRPPCLLESVSLTNSTLQEALSQSFGSAHATLLASAELLRAMHRKQIITIGDENDNAQALADLNEADLRNVDEDPGLDIDANFDEPPDSVTRPSSPELLDHFFIIDPKFCPVCYRTIGSRKYCSQHQNTDGKSRVGIREAQQVFPQYRKALAALLRRLRTLKYEDLLVLSSESFLATKNPVTVEALQNQTLSLLPKLLRSASWGLKVGDRNEAQQRLAGAETTLTARILNVSVAHPVAWTTAAWAVSDLFSLSLEVESICSRVDLLADNIGRNVVKEKLLGHELRLFSSAYMADMLLRMVDMFGNPAAIVFVPEDIRSDFYLQWLQGYQPIYSIGHAPNTEAHDSEFVLTHLDQSAFTVEELWKHFCRIAAWRVAQQLPPTKKPRLRRLPREVVLAHRAAGKTAAEIAGIMETTVEGVVAALARWDAKSS